MKKNLHDIDKLFKTALENQEETPSQAVWDALDKKLDKNKVVDLSRKYIQLRRIAIILVVLLLGAGVYTISTWNRSGELTKNVEKNKEVNIDTVVSALHQNKSKKIESTPVNKNTVENTTLEHPAGNLENEKEFNHQGEFTGAASFKNSSGQAGKKTLSEQEISVPTDKKGRRTMVINEAPIERKSQPGEIQPGEREDEMYYRPGTLPLANLPLLSPVLPDRTKKNVPSVDNILPYNPGKSAATVKPFKSKEASFGLTAFCAPNISSSRIQEEKGANSFGTPPPPGDHKKIRDGEKPHSSSTFGVLIEYNRNKHWGLQSGVAVYNKTISIDPKTIYADVDNNGDVKYLYNCSSGYLFLSSKLVTTPAVGDSIKAFESTNSLQYVFVPLSIKYTYPVNKLSLFASGGVSANFLTKGEIKTEIENGPVKETSTSTKINGLKTIYFGGIVSIGASYHISDKIGVSFLPSYNFALTSGTKNAIVKSYPNLLSLAAGISYKF
ncbi:MAG: porin family protein [Ferruginibacter sp.]|nr:porin family protein [Ferruginibacter sp.]